MVLVQSSREQGNTYKGCLLYTSLPYDKLGLAAPMRERGSVQVEEYREDGLYLEGIVKTEDLHYFEGYLV